MPSGQARHSLVAALRRGFFVADEDVFIRQIAALPYRPADRAGDVMVLLVTSRETGRWVLPKGNRMAGRKAHRAAEIEAEEEAGVRGAIARVPLGRYRYRKWLDARRYQVAKVDVFALEVHEELAAWKEQGQRERRWVKRSEAAQMVEEAELRALILSARLAQEPVEGVLRSA